VNPLANPAAAFVTAPPRRVVFLCVHNSARSQMAEGFARAMAPKGVEVWSAGMQPRSVHPVAIEVMHELGIDISGQRSKPLADVPLAEADTVVTVCDEADEVCPPVAAGVRRVHWPLPDPAAAPEKDRPNAFREARDEIHWRVSSLWPRGE
jgi:arsenate reductase